MSSFIGHGLAALTIGRIDGRGQSPKNRLFWQACLLLCVYAPDADYLFPSLNYINNGGLRITHSIVSSLIAPAGLTLLYFLFDRKNVFWRAFQASLAGLSHLILDLLVGGRGGGDPLFYPFSAKKYALPFGILPSAGALNITNYYFYRNLLIEIGILIPAFAFILIVAGKLKINRSVGAGLFFVFVAALLWSINLKR